MWAETCQYLLSATALGCLLLPVASLGRSLSLVSVRRVFKSLWKEAPSERDFHLSQCLVLPSSSSMAGRAGALAAPEQHCGAE